MTRTCTAMALALLSLSGAAWSAAPLVRVKLAPASQVMVGEPVRMTVTVMVPSWFTSAPQFPAIDMQTAIAVLTDDPAVNSNERIGEDSYAGVSRDYLIYPQTPGKHELPPAEVTFAYAIDAKPSGEIKLKIPQQAITAVVPKEAEGMGYFIATTQLTLQQTLSRKLADLKAGDSFHRVVTMHAEKTYSMFLPELEFEAPDGIAVYPDAPQVKDISDPRMGFERGQRIDSAQYVIQKAGKYTLPEISVSWWDLNARRMRTVRLKAIEFEAAPNPSYSPEIPPKEPETAAAPIRESPWERAKRILPWVGGALATLAALWWFIASLWPRWRKSMREARERREHAEPILFGHVSSAAKADDGARAYAALARWVPLALGEPGATIRDFVVAAGSQGFAREASRLESRLYSGGSGAAGWSGGAFVTELKPARLACLKRAEEGRQRGRELLPPLNP